ncbi:MAG: HDIG domain-containing protein [Planctomycetes bacterium]|nr:HDIG domain-containing protein [Planctomycetota bacterium]
MAPPAPLDPAVLAVVQAIGASGGRAVLVGGWVRDWLLGLGSKDYDFEVYGLELGALERVLGAFGDVIAVGKSFGVLRVKGLDVDFSIPRRDSKAGRGHRGFLVELDPTLDFAEAASRRDLTLNSIGLDPLTGEVLDPHGGRRDLERKMLRATDAAKFAEDSLRALRVAQFRARFEMEPDEELRRICGAIDISDLPGERIFEELRKLLLKARRPSLGLAFLGETGLLRFFPELASMVGVPQDKVWHPEGTVWEHTLMVVDEAAASRTGGEAEDLAVMLGALCHDLGKPLTTVVDGDRVRSPEHEERGVPVAEAFLSRLRAPGDLTAKVCGLVRFHLAPATFPQGGASPKAYRRLARRLEEAGINARVLHRLARADHFGRTTEDALARVFPSGDEFLRRMEDLAVERSAPKDVVLGRHLLARGFVPSPWFGEVLGACRDVQDETGWDDPDRILDRVLAERGEERTASSSKE